MPGIITKAFRLHTATQFKEQFEEADFSRMYVFVGRPKPWPDDNNPPTPVDTIEDSIDAWNTMISLKKISSADVSFAANRINWTTGTVYQPYTSNTSNSGSFYVITDEYQVYKCMGNNGGAASTVKPTGRLTTVFTTADKYKWKYMYEIGATEALKYLTTNYIPVKHLTANNGSYQWTIQQAAVNGAIETVGVKTGGTGYRYHANTLQMANSTTATLASSANNLNDYYNGLTIYISSGTGSGQLREIIDYDGSSKLATVNTSFATPPDSTSGYVVSPKIKVDSGDGTGFSSYSVVTSGAISSVEVINRGQNYSYATLTLSGNSGSGGSLVAHIAPPNGHGSNPVTELDGHNVILNIKFTGNESNTFFTDNDFRTVGIIVDPKLANGSFANAASYMVAATLTVNSVSGTFQSDETLTGSTSGATAVYIESANTTVYRINELKKNFSAAETITGGTSGATATVVSQTKSPMKLYSGQLIYLEYRTPVSRSNEQVEDLKIISKF